MRTRAETITALISRDGHRCGLCEEVLDGPIDIDHVKPRRHGGHLTDLDNLQLTHPRCNRSKADAWNGQPAARERVMHGATLNIKAPQELIDNLKRLAERNHVTLSNYVRRLLMRHVERTAG